MGIASTSRTTVAYVQEATFGVTPTNPAWQKVRHTGGNLDTQKATVVSDEIQMDRNIRDELQVAQDVKGSYDYEFSANAFDALMAGALMSDWTNDVLINGRVGQSFSVEEITDMGGGSLAYNRFVGVMIDEMSMNIASRAIVKGSFTLMGQSEATDVAILAGATYLDPPTDPIQTSVMVANLSVVGLAAQPKVKSLQLAIKNNLRVRDVVGNLHTLEFGMGMCDITGSIDCYFESEALHQAVLAHGSAAISFRLGSSTGEHYDFLLPVARFLSGSRKLGGKNDDVMVSIPFRAIFDPATNGSIKITRNIA